MELRKEGYDVEDTDTLHVLSGRSGGYKRAYDGYVEEVAKGSLPKG